jgi:hypothetical protein
MWLIPWWTCISRKPSTCNLLANVQRCESELRCIVSNANKHRKRLRSKHFGQFNRLPTIREASICSVETTPAGGCVEVDCRRPPWSLIASSQKLPNVSGRIKIRSVFFSSTTKINHQEPIYCRLAATLCHVHRRQTLGIRL